MHDCDLFPFVLQFLFYKTNKSCQNEVTFCTSQCVGSCFSQMVLDTGMDGSQVRGSLLVMSCLRLNAMFSSCNGSVRNLYKQGLKDMLLAVHIYSTE